MSIEPISLSHRGILEPRFRRMGLDLSEYTFSNTYLFRQIHRFEVVTGKDIYIRGQTRDGVSFLMPTSPLQELDLDTMFSYLGQGDCVYPIPEAWKSHFDESKYIITSLDQDSDYLYNVQSMQTYAGRHLAGRRNLVNQFHDKYPDHQVMPLDKTRISDALIVLDHWKCHAHKDERYSDYAECLEALKLFCELELEGHLTYVEGKPAAFILGEPLNGEVYLFNFAKADVSYKGIYQFIYQEFARSLKDKYRYINLEQDLGSDDLQHAKRAYLPDHLSVKLRVSLKP